MITANNAEKIDSQKVIPLPKDRETTCILGENNEVKGYINKRRVDKFGGDYFVGFRSGFEGLASMDLTGEQYKVLMYLFSKLDFDNFLKVAQKDIAEKLSMQKSHVSRAIKGLLEQDIIAVGPMAGHSKTYRLNPRIAHRGSKNYQQTIIEYDALKARRKKDKEDETKKEEPVLVAEPLKCPECGERLELIDYDCDQKGWYVCTNRDCDSMFPPEEINQD